MYGSFGVVGWSAGLSRTVLSFTATREAKVAVVVPMGVGVSDHIGEGPLVELWTPARGLHAHIVRSKRTVPYSSDIASDQGKGFCLILKRVSVRRPLTVTVQP